MKEKILLVEEFTDWAPDKEAWNKYDGFRVLTDKQDIRFGITNGSSCCEDFGYFSTNDNLKEFVGADLSDISLTGTDLLTKKIAADFPYGFDSGGVMFVTIKTSKGDLQFAAYNSHNGYYGHTAKIWSEQVTHEESL